MGRIGEHQTHEEVLSNVQEKCVKAPTFNTPWVLTWPQVRVCLLVSVCQCDSQKRDFRGRSSCPVQR